MARDDSRKAGRDLGDEDVERDRIEEGGDSIEEPLLRSITKSPPNAEAASRSTFRNWQTPTDAFFVRSHYDTPDIDAESWTVTVQHSDGEIRDWSMDQIRDELPTESLRSTMACAGLGRSAFEPSAMGQQWRSGAVGNARWTGTPVVEVLGDVSERALEGRWLTVLGGDAPEGEDIYTRSIPMEKIMDDCLLAYGMNGEELPPDHGYPIRLIVPGWYGCNSVKWVERLIVTDQMVCGPDWEEGSQRLYTHWQQYSYRLVPYGEEKPNQRPDVSTFDLLDQMRNEAIEHPFLFEQIVHSLIAAPEDGAEIRGRGDEGVEIVGVAWAGEDEIDRVEVSVDGGSNWAEAELFGPDAGPTAWRQFRYSWSPSPGEYTLVSRSTDARGRTQPLRISGSDRRRMSIEDDAFPANRRGYGNNAYGTYGVEISVRE